MMKRPVSLRHSAIRTIFKREYLNIDHVPIGENRQSWLQIYYQYGTYTLVVFTKSSSSDIAMPTLIAKYKRQ
jgi:hypothetical protein